MSTKLAQTITKRIAELDLKFAHVAVACDVSEAAVRAWVAESYRPRDEKLPALAKVLKMTVADLVRV